MPTIAISLSEDEQMRLEEILVDGDEKEALEFLQKIIKAKINAQEQSHCKPPF